MTDPRRNGLRTRPCGECGQYGMSHRPNCSRASTSKLERSGGLQQGSGPKRTPLKQISRKQMLRARTLAQLRQATMDAGLTGCEIRWEGVCRGTFDHWHHLRKRSHGGGDEPENLVRSCDPCNSQVEDEPIEAQRRGWVIR